VPLHSHQLHLAVGAAAAGVMQNSSGSAICVTSGKHVVNYAPVASPDSGASSHP
jgi:hypothetical protein